MPRKIYQPAYATWERRYKMLTREQRAFIDNVAAALVVAMRAKGGSNAKFGIEAGRELALALACFCWPAFCEAARGNKNWDGRHG